MKKLLVATATQKSMDGFKKQPLYESLFITEPECDFTKKHAFFKDREVDLIAKIDNTQIISKHYNKSIKFAIDNSDDYDYILFVHDDVSIEDKFLCKKLADGLREFDMLGLAGGKNLKLNHPALWHLMCSQDSWSGAVAHPFEKTKFSMTSFGPMPQRCLLLDGLFFALKIETLKNNPKVKFDEKIPTVAHFYDLDFCLTANQNGLKLTTWPIWVTHLSPGLEAPSDEFKKAAGYFIDKWT
tara:strand:- start:309 stop:1031 length:723 start_codon:yes stop_codon:yes gene_type:complete